MRRYFLLIFTCAFGSIATAAQGNWFVFDLGEKKSEVCEFLQTHSEYAVISSKKCPDIDDNPTIDVTETITTETFNVPETASCFVSIRLVFKHDRLLAMLMTFPSDCYDGVYERARKTFRKPRSEQGLALDPIWQDKARHEISEKPTNWMVVFVKGITRVYLVRYNKVQDGIMTGWVGLESRTENEPR